MDCLIVGCGLCGITVARTLAEKGKKVHIIERRTHIGGNLYDYRNEDGLLVQKYGPHSFFTNNEKIREYVERFIPVKDSFIECRTVINGQSIPMPFSFASIDLLYPPAEAEELKHRLCAAFPGSETVAVQRLVEHEDPLISGYGRFMYENEYRLYTAKQWGRSIDSISPAVFGRVPVYLSYKKPYQPHPYQFIPVQGFTAMAAAMLDSPNITVEIGQDALARLTLTEDPCAVRLDGERLNCPVVYTGALDELFGYRFGALPYRSLEFIWKTLPCDSAQPTAMAAYPQAEKMTRITEYKKLPPQELPGKTVIAIEIPFEYDRNMPVGNEPYYPVLNEETRACYDRYQELAERYPTLFAAGRLADYQYYNMDQIIERAWQISEQILKKFGQGG